MTWPVLTGLDQSWLDLICPDLTWPVPTWHFRTWPTLTWPTLTWNVQTWLVSTKPVLGSGKGCTSRFLGVPVNFSKTSFLIWALLLLLWEPRKIQNGRQGAPKWPTGSGKGSTPRFFHKRTPSMRKGCDREEEGEEEKNGKNGSPLLLCQSTAWIVTDWNSDCLCQ